MWTPALFAELARLSHAGTTLATFTCAGFVRRGLNEAGFAMAKVPGFGHKREMLAGALERPVAPTPCLVCPPNAPQGPRTALVIGAGLAGCATAASWPAAAGRSGSSSATGRPPRRPPAIPGRALSQAVGP